MTADGAKFTIVMPTFQRRDVVTESVRALGGQRNSPPFDVVVVVDDRVAWVGPASKAPAADRVVDVGGRAVTPGFVDSHSHLVYAGDRASEFSARMAGVPYDGGGIGVSVAATRAASDA